MDRVMTLPHRAEDQVAAPSYRSRFAFEDVIDRICAMPWERLSGEEILRVAKAYYFFSVQFRENLELACELWPRDPKLEALHRGECATDNLSPYPGVAAQGEKLDHDEFMRRLLAMQPVDADGVIEGIGRAYLDQIRALRPAARAVSIASYEDGGLSRVFSAMLRAPEWRGAGQEAFRFFLEQHIRFDTDDAGGHGSLSRHLVPNDDILPLWKAFAELLAAAAPRLGFAAASEIRQGAACRAA
jgi:hypothetical protein